MHTDGYVAAIPTARLNVLLSKHGGPFPEDQAILGVLGLVCPCIRGERRICDALVNELRSPPGHGKCA